MIHYIIQIVVFQLLFLAVYDLFLKKETFFQYNRLYLIATPIVSLILPWLRIEAVERIIPSGYTVQLPEVLIGGFSETTLIQLNPVTVTGTAQNVWTLFEWIQNIWLAGAILATAWLLVKFFRIAKLKRQGTTQRWNGMKLVILPKTDTAFSFFNTIFLGEDLSEAQKESILLHEQTHIKQRHTADLLIFELQRIFFWFNPLVYIFQNRIMTLQEYIADAQASSKSTKKAYYQSLLSQVFQTEAISFINPFFNQSLIRLNVFGLKFSFGKGDGQVKKRIVMLQKSKSKNPLLLKYLLLIPMICGMLLYTACTNEAGTKAEESESADYVAGSEDSEIIQRVNDLLEAVAKKGNISKEEEDALKQLHVLTSPEGVNSSSFDDVKDQVTIPFGAIQQVPVYPGCEGDKEALKSCFSQKIAAFVGAEFNTKIAPESVSGRQRISTQFKIDRQGNVVDIKAKAEFPAFEAEAIRVLKKLPQMTPGMNDGKKVSVMYSLPIMFEIK